MGIILKISGLILIIAGFVFACRPDLFNSSQVQLAGYERIEKRVKWGFLIGLGIFLIFHQQWADWRFTLWGLLSALTFGIILARLLGLVLDGFFAKQMLWLLIELAVLAVFVLLYWRHFKSVSS